MDCKEKKKRCSIGGQAVLEGVMMRGSSVMATAVRNPDGKIVVEAKRFEKKKGIFYKFPIVRGVISFLNSMILGVKTLTNSAKVWMDVELEPPSLEKTINKSEDKKKKINEMDIAVFIGVILGLGFSIVLFFLLPTFLVSLLKLIPIFSQMPEWVRAIFEGIIRLMIFVCYIMLVSLMKDIKRTFMYHGAEHKTISCYELQRELTIENTKDLTTVHDRCGTTFLFIVMIIALILFTTLSGIKGIGELMANNIWARIGIRLALLPLIAGISFEFLKLFSLSDNIVFRILKAPGLLLQKLTTKEPTDDMVEVAIVAFNTVMEMENDLSIPEKSFEKSLAISRKNKLAFLDKGGIKGSADIDFMICDILNIKRSDISKTYFITEEQDALLEEYVVRRIKGEPLQQILGKTNFYGVDIKLNKNVLIPRFETEEVVKNAINIIKESHYNSALDLCTGSGCIALALKKELSYLNVTATDVSKDALAIAKENATKNNFDITFIESDLFSNITERFDLIISNPPYISEEEYEILEKEVKEHEPKLALVGKENGLEFYKKIVANIENYLKESGTLVLEIGYKQKDDIENILKEKFNCIEFHKDIAGNYRIAVAKL